MFVSLSDCCICVFVSSVQTISSITFMMTASEFSVPL